MGFVFMQETMSFYPLFRFILAPFFKWLTEERKLVVPHVRQSRDPQHKRLNGYPRNSVWQTIDKSRNAVFRISRYESIL